MANYKKKDTKPFSLRLTFQERATLEGMANKEPLGTFIKRTLFAEKVHVTKANQTETSRYKAQILGMLGQSELTKNMQELADAAKSGSLPMTPDTEAMLIKGLEQLILMKKLLLTEMKVQSGERL